MPFIPLQLYRSITKHAEQPTLCTLLLVSRDWHREAERCLYETIIISPLDPGPWQFKPRHELATGRKAMLLALSQSPHLMLHVVNLDLSGLYYQDTSIFPRPQWTGFMPAISQGCPNLKCLYLPSQFSRPFVPPTNARFQLRTFGFKSYLRLNGQSIDHGDFRGVGPFLESQPEIDTLIIPEYIILEPLQPGSLPNLRSISAPVQACSWLLPSRPVEEVQLSVPVIRESIFDFEGFGQLPHVKRLSLPSPFATLFWFADCFGQLESLKLTLVCNYVFLVRAASELIYIFLSNAGARWTS